MDEKAEAYYRLKDALDAATEKQNCCVCLSPLKEELIQLVRAFGSAHAEKSRLLHGITQGMMVTFGSSVSIDAAAVERFRGRTILPGVRDDFQQELGRKFPRGKLVQRIAEGLDAKAIKLAQFEGDFTDKRYLVDYSERRRYVELAAKLLGYLVEKVEVTGAEQAPLDFKLQVNFVDPAEGARRKLLDDAEPEADERISGEPAEGDQLP